MPLKVTLGGVEYTAPAPKAVHFKGYIRLMRITEQTGNDLECKDVDAQVEFIASLFCNPDVTAARLWEELSFSDMFRLRRDYAAFMNAAVPQDDAKNGKSR